MESMSNGLPDSVLWNQVLRRDASAFEQLVSRYQASVAAVAFSLLRDFAACQDVAQETFLVAWRDAGQLQDPGRIGAWLCGIARNLAKGWQRRSQRPADAAVSVDPELACVASDEDPAAAMISQEEQTLVQNSLDELPEQYREALVLFYHHDHSVRDVAAVLEVSEEAVRQRLSRGRAMLRERVAEVVEDVLRRARPGRAFTATVMAGLASAAVGGTATAATPAVAGSAVTGVVGSSLAKGLASGSAAAGIAGGLTGAAGGLAGAWLGTWLPAEMAPTQTERELVRTSGRRMMAASLIYTVVLLSASGFFFIRHGWIAWLVLTAISTIAFVTMTIRTVRQLNRDVLALRERTTPESDPNPSSVRARLMAAVGGVHGGGRRYTSRLRLLGLPLIDVQLSPPFGSLSPAPDWRPACGWIAVGDRATGLLAIGGHTRGVVAFGASAVGIIAIGGIAVGLVSLGGLALGVASFGGLAVGYSAMGGLALAWHDASGGGAIAWHAAYGGLAVARDAATGGGAFAAEANSEVAWKTINACLSKTVMDAYIAHHRIGLAILLGLSLFPAFVITLLSRGGRPQDQAQKTQV